jgi:hypothetical protein
MGRRLDRLTGLPALLQQRPLISTPSRGQPAGWGVVRVVPGRGGLVIWVEAGCGVGWWQGGEEAGVCG